MTNPILSKTVSSNLKRITKILEQIILLYGIARQLKDPSRDTLFTTIDTLKDEVMALLDETKQAVFEMQKIESKQTEAA